MPCTPPSSRASCATIPTGKRSRSLKRPQPSIPKNTSPSPTNAKSRQPNFTDQDGAIAASCAANPSTEPICDVADYNIATLKKLRDCVESMVWKEIVRNHLINMMVIRIHKCAWDLAAVLRALIGYLSPNMAIIKEPRRARWAWHGQGHEDPWPHTTLVTRGNVDAQEKSPGQRN